MGIWHYQQLDAWRLANEFKLAVFALVKHSPAIRQEHRFRSQLIESARSVSKNIAEGFVRRSPATFVLYLTYGLASLAEAEEHVKDAVELDYVTADASAPVLLLAKRCSVATSRLRKSQESAPRRPPRARDQPTRPRPARTDENFPGADTDP